ncbi:MAG: ferrochelatase [Nocardioides sp.]
MRGVDSRGDGGSGEHRQDADPAPYDGVLLVSFGGPERAEDVVPFLRNVTRGRDIPAERLAEVGEHYFARGGRSPINDLNRELLAAVRADFAGAGLDLPVYWGNRNWAPYLTDTVRQMREDGITRAICFVTSAYSSYSGCRQYRENLAAAVAEVPDAPRLDRLRHYFNHPGFQDSVIDATLSALDRVPAGRPATILFVTHSIPLAMNEASGSSGRGYTRQHESVMAEVMNAVRLRTSGQVAGELVYCSRSGAPSVPWLEPDVNDRIADLAEAGTTDVVLVPIGFVSDHMEVVHDLDTEAVATGRRHGVAVVRAATAGTDARFVRMVRELVLERAAAERGESPVRAVHGALPPEPDRCVGGCCRNPRTELPALGGCDETAAG